VDHFDFFAFGVEDQTMLADDRPTAEGVYADLSFSTRRNAFSPVDGDLVQVLPPALGSCSREQLSG